MFQPINLVPNTASVDHDLKEHLDYCRVGSDMFGRI